jgi:hypothetical protein
MNMITWISLLSGYEIEVFPRKCRWGTVSHVNMGQTEMLKYMSHCAPPEVVLLSYSIKSSAFPYLI